MKMKATEHSRSERWRDHDLSLGCPTADMLDGHRVTQLLWKHSQNPMCVPTLEPCAARQPSGGTDGGREFVRSALPFKAKSFNACREGQCKKIKGEFQLASWSAGAQP